MSKNNPVTGVSFSSSNGELWLTIHRKKEENNYPKCSRKRKYLKFPGRFLRRCFSILTAFNANGLNGNLKFNALKDN